MNGNAEFTSLDDLEDLPGFEPLLTGSYSLMTEEIDFKFLLNEGKADQKRAAKFSFTVVEVLETAETPEPGNAPPKVGDKAEFVYMLDNEYGRGFLKKLASVYGEKLGTRDADAIAEGGKGLAILAVVKRTWDEKKKRHFANIATATVL